MNLQMARQMLSELVAERGQLKREREELLTRVAELDRRMAETDELGSAMSKYLNTRDGTAQETLSGLSVETAVPERDLAERSQRILAVLDTGPRDWPLDRVLNEMRSRGWLEGLRNPREAVRIALDRMSPTYVVRVRPAVYTLRRRLAEPVALIDTEVVQR